MDFWYFYFQFWSAFNAYSAILLGIMSIIFAVTSCATLFRYPVIICSVFGKLYEALMASLCSWLTTQLVQNFHDDNDFKRVFTSFPVLLSIGIIYLVYLGVLALWVGALYDVYKKQAFEYRSSWIKKVFHAANIFFVAATGVLVAIYFITVAVILVWNLLLFSWFFFKWPFNYIINRSYMVTKSVKKVGSSVTTNSFTSMKFLELKNSTNTTIH